MPKYQGREITCTVQANTKGQLDRLIGGLNDYAKSQGLERVQIVQKRKDPDGGYEAIVRAHNFNPLRVAKENWIMRLTPDEKLQIARQGLALRKGKTAIKLEKLALKKQVLFAKQEVAKEKQQLANQKLELARVKEQRKQLRTPILAGLPFFPTKHPAPTPRKKKKKKQSVYTLSQMRG